MSEELHAEVVSLDQRKVLEQPANRHRRGRGRCAQSGGVQVAALPGEGTALPLQRADQSVHLGILREAGIPIESVRGPYGGYRLGRGLRLPPLMFSAAGALGLVMAVLDGHHNASDPTDPVGNALGKIMRALPQSVAAQADAVRRTTAPAPDRAAARPDPETTAALVQACSDTGGRGSTTAPRQGRNGSPRSTRGR